MSWTITTAKPELADFMHVAENMREADKIEVFELNASTPMQALTQSANTSDITCVVRLNGEPVVILGVGSLSLATKRGIPWLLGTDEVYRNAPLFMHMTKKIFPVISRNYSYLTNVIHEDNKQSERWLKFMGFEFGEAQPVGWRGAKFKVFAKDVK